MILAVDVDYREDYARVAGILFRDWGDAHPATERVVELDLTRFSGHFIFTKRGVRDGKEAEDVHAGVPATDG